jgi:hypothetical protein
MYEIKPTDRLIKRREAIGARQGVGRKRAQRLIVSEDVFNPAQGFPD